MALAVPCEWRFPDDKKTSRGTRYSTFNDIAFGDGVYVIAGEGFLLRSEDAKKWHRIPFAEDLQFTSVVAGKGLFVVAGPVILRSKDGLNWTDTGCAKLQHNQTPSCSSFTSLAWNGKRYVALAADGALLSDDGATWISVPYKVPMQVRVQWANGFFISLHSLGVSQSVDGEHWLPPFITDFDNFAGVATNGDITVIVTATGFIYTSTNGEDWNSFEINDHFPATMGSKLNLLDIAWNGQRFVAVGFEGLMLVSEDGLQWRMHVQPMKKTDWHNRHMFVAIRWLNGRFMTLDSSGGLHTSVDGLTWTSSRPTGIACPQCAVLTCSDP